jgi:transcriptional regulator with GAF, ATPase, and Fis domain
LREQIDQFFMFEEIVGTSRALQAIVSRVVKVAPPIPACLSQARLARSKISSRAIHERSARSQRAFVSVNCAALTPSLISSELFANPSATAARTERQYFDVA